MEVDEQSSDAPTTSDDSPAKVVDDLQTASTSTETAAITSNVDLTSKFDLTASVGDSASSSSDVANESADESAKQVGLTFLF